MGICQGIDKGTDKGSDESCAREPTAQTGSPTTFTLEPDKGSLEPAFNPAEVVKPAGGGSLEELMRRRIRSITFAGDIRFVTDPNTNTSLKMVYEFWENDLDKTDWIDVSAEYLGDDIEPPLFFLLNFPQRVIRDRQLDPKRLKKLLQVILSHGGQKDLNSSKYAFLASASFECEVLWDEFIEISELDLNIPDPATQRTVLLNLVRERNGGRLYQLLRKIDRVNLFWKDGNGRDAESYANDTTFDLHDGDDQRVRTMIRGSIATIKQSRAKILILIQNILPAFPITLCEIVQSFCI